MERFGKYFEKYPTLMAIGHTPMVRLRLFEDECPDVLIFAKCEYANPGGSLKDRPVRHMLLDALSRGVISPERTILDSSSGNAGIAYAMIGAMIGVPVELVIPGNASSERKMRIRAHGAHIIETDPVEGYDQALRHAHELAEADPDKYFLCNQYKNDFNWISHYDTTAVEIIEQLPQTPTHFVSSVGTGGTITGIGRRLKEHDPSTQVVLAVPDDFPGIEGLKPLGPGNIIPEIFDQSVVDHRIDVTIDDAFEMCGRLATQGLFVGQSSGAYVHVCHQLAKEIKTGVIVTTLNDIGERYFSTRLWD